MKGNAGKHLASVLQKAAKKGTTAYDATATVVRIEGDTLWVHIPGGVDETPIRKTINALPGDNVQVRVSGGRAWITGNKTAPPTDDRVANTAVNIANKVEETVTVFKEVVAESFQAVRAKIGFLEVDTAKIHNLTADQLTASVGYIEDLTAEQITAGDISADHAAVENLDTNYAKINAANIDKATIREAWVDQIMVQSGLLAHEGTIFELDAIQVNASKIKAGTLDVERLIVTVDGEKYMVHVDPSTGSPSYQKVDANVLEDLTITADKIVAGAITAEKITAENIVGTSGWINLHLGRFFYGNGNTWAACTQGIMWDGTSLKIKGAVDITSGNVYTKTDVDNKFKDYTKTSDFSIAPGEIKASVEAVQTNLDNLEVGGRNLIKATSLESNKKWTINSCSAVLSDNKVTIENAGEFQQGVVTTPYCRVIKAGTKLTLSCYIYENTIKANRRIYYAKTPSWRARNIPEGFTGLWVDTFEAPDDITVLTIDYDMRNRTEGKIVCGPCKLEIGTKATTWTPAPEDLEDYADSAVSTAKAEIKITTDGISSEVSKKVGTSEVISKINQSPESVTINANRVNIEGATIFSSGRLSTSSLNNAYDAKGAASAVQTNLDNLSIGGRNILKNSDKSVLYLWGTAKNNGGTMTIEEGKTVSEWGTNEARRVYGKAGSTNNLFGIIDKVYASSQLSIANQPYVFSVYIKNQGTNAISINFNGLASGVTVAAGKTVRVVSSNAKGNGTNNAQFTVAASAASAAYDFIYWHPQIEYGTKVTDWSPAPEDAVPDNFLKDAKAARTLNITATDNYFPWYYESEAGHNVTAGNVEDIFLLSYDWSSDGITAGNFYPQIYSTSSWVVSNVISAVGTRNTGAVNVDPTATNNKGHVEILFRLHETQANQTIQNVRFRAYDGITQGGSITISNVKFCLAPDGATIGAAKKTADAAAPKTSAVSEEQLIYISKASGTTSVAANTTWVTATSDSQNTWTTKRPTYNSSYPVLFIAKQKKTVSGTVTCTTPLKDDTTTVIDGGHITTGTIDASKATITNINASNIKSGTLAAARLGANSITADKIAVGAIGGGTNLFGYGSKCESLEGFSLSGAWNIVTEDGYKCAHASCALNETRYIRSSLPFTPKPLETVTFSAWIKIKNIVVGTTNPMCEFYFGGETISGSWKGWTNISQYVDGVSVGTSSVRFNNMISDTKWHYVTRTCKAVDANFTTNLAPFIYMRDCTGDLYVRDIKYERGSIATDWTPAPEDYYQADQIENLSSEAKLFKNLAYYSSNLNPGTGYISIVTPILPARMCSVHITGYNYSTANGQSIDITVNFYNYSNSIVHHVFVNSGNFNVGEVRIGQVSASDQRAVIILGTASTQWHYPRLCVESALITYNTPPLSYKNGWTINAPNTSYASYATNIVTKVNEHDPSKTATKYITHINDAGISVHPAGATTSRAEIIADGMHVYQANTEVAHYGATARIGKPTSSNTGNVYIDNDSVDIRKGSTVLSTFTANGAEIGKNSRTAQIKFCNGLGTLYGDLDDNDYITMGLKVETVDDLTSCIELSAHSENTSQGTYDASRLSLGADGLSIMCAEASDTVTLNSYLDMSATSRLMYTAPDFANNEAQIGVTYMNRGSSAAGVWIGYGAGGSNAGLYSTDANKWIAFINTNNGQVASQPVYSKTTTGSANVNVSNSSFGYLMRHTSSSRRYKTEIEDINDPGLDPEKLYDVRVVQFKYRDDYLDSEDQRYGRDIPGFIVEELEEVYPIAVEYEDEMPEDWNARYLIPGMLKLIQDQHSEIEELRSRIEALERRL